jgi:pimeloyl-ACP methyl ester carboxylesterase/glycosidase
MKTWRVGQTSRRALQIGPTEIAEDGSLRIADLAAVRRLAARLNETSDAPTASAGEIVALGLLHEVAHVLIDRYEAEIRPGAVAAALAGVETAVGKRTVDRVLRRLATEFGPEPDRAEALESLFLLALAGENPAADPIRPLADPEPVAAVSGYPEVLSALDLELGSLDGEAAKGFGPAGESLVEMLRAPARHAPSSLAAQLRYIRERWRALLPADLIDRLVGGEDLLAEESRGLHLRFGGGGAGGGDRKGQAPSFAGADVESERFSEDRDWMPRLVLLAKSTYVWLDQLSRRHGREIRTLDAIPDEELAAIASRGITGLWLIGLWQRSKASEKIKRWRGNADAVASAYSLDDYRIADDLGGEDALADLRSRAWGHGIRLASDMVPNHMGIDSRWVIHHPERFISVDEPPFPAYRFEGRNLADDDRIEIRIEDHYWDDSDAAVVFERRDKTTGERRYIYHGNDGTSFPWNDTAQLDFLKAEVREVVIQTILDVARRFPVIRFDAAMVLAKRHVQRLWYPEPGHGGAIPSRSAHALTKKAFDALMPNEFWRDVVDRVAAEAPDTLLLAEAFWMMEGYFVRTLGMHRVYNSAFMHMLRDENNAGYRKVIRDTVEFDPAILGRYVNFLTNPDEETAIEQFGTGDKYFGAATLLATMPGLPMIGHGQLEGFTEKYGMEFQRARLDEQPNAGLTEYFDAQIVPLLRDRHRFASSADFRLYDVVADGGELLEDVFAYSNGRGADRSLIVYHNKFGSTAGWIRDSIPFAVKAADGSKRIERDTLAAALGLTGPGDGWLRFRDSRSGRESLRSVGEVRQRGLHVQVDAYGCLVLLEIAEVADSADAPWSRLAAQIGGETVASLDEALATLSARDRTADAAASRADRGWVPAATAVPARDRSLRLRDGRRVAYAEWGDADGSPVLLFHGMPGSRLLCPDERATRAAGVRLIAIDRPGYGGSDPRPGRTIADGADDVAELIQKLHLPPVPVVGWSSGGPYALACAARIPKLVSSIGVVAGDGPPDDVPGFWDEASPELRELVDAVRSDPATARPRVAERLAWYAVNPAGIVDEAPNDPDDPDTAVRTLPAVAAALKAMFVEGARQGADGFVDDWIATVLPWGFALADIERDVRLWWGDGDRLTTRAHTDHLATALPHGRLTIYPGEGHSIAITHWADILDALLERASGTPAGG